MAELTVTWNQYAPEFTATNYEPYDSENIDVDYADNMLTVTWKKDVNSYRSSVISYNITPRVGDKWYCSLLHNPSKTGTYAVIAPQTGHFAGTSCTANTWTRVSGIAVTNSNVQTRIGYIPRLTSSATGMIGNTCKVKGNIQINLTQMFGAGKEPASVEEFEAQCAINGVDLTASHP